MDIEAVADVLLSIKPRYTELILTAVKRYEIRRGKTRIRTGDRIFIYSSSPRSAVVAACYAGEVLEMTPRALFRTIGAESGLDRMSFNAYVKGAEIVVAIELLDVVEFSIPHQLTALRKMLGGFVAPQSYRYMRPHEAAVLLRRAAVIAEDEPKYTKCTFDRGKRE